MPSFSSTALALWIGEALIILGAFVWLLRRRQELLPALLGLGPGRLTPSTRQPTELAMAFGFAFGAAFLASFGLYAADLWPIPAKGEVNTFTAVSAVVFQFGLFAGLAHAWFWHLRQAPQPPLPRLTARQILKAAFITFAVLLFTMSATAVLWEQVLELLGIDAGPQDVVALLAKRGDSLEVLIVLLSAVTLAPFTEEILFRALLFRWLRTRLPRGLALLLPAFFFAAVHGFVAVFVPLAVLSVVLALAYERSGHPAVPILAHAFFNLNTIVLVLAGFSA